MAQKVNLIKNGLIKEGYVGFSWTSFFFGFFVPLFRKDWITGGVIFLLSAIAGLLTGGIGSFIFSIILGFAYNKYYTKNLIEKCGFLPMSSIDSVLLQQNEIFVENINNLNSNLVENARNSTNFESNKISLEGTISEPQQVFTQRIVTENINLTKGEIMSENSKTNQYDVELEKLKFEKSTDDTKYIRDIVEKTATNEHDVAIASANSEVNKLKVDIDKTKTLQGNQENRDNQEHEQKMRMMELEIEKLKLTNNNQETRNLHDNAKNKVGFIAVAIVAVTLIVGAGVYLKSVNSIKAEGDTVTKLKQLDNQVEVIKAIQGNQESRDRHAHEAEMKRIVIVAEQEKIKLELEIEESRRKAEAEARARKAKIEAEAIAARRRVEAANAEVQRKRDAEATRVRAEKEKEINDMKILQSIINGK